MSSDYLEATNDEPDNDMLAKLNLLPLFAGLRARLLLLVLLAVLPALGLTLYTGLEQRQTVAAAVHAGVLRLAERTSRDQEAMITDARQLLQRLAELPEVRSGDSTTCSARLADLLEELPHYANLGVIQPDGNVVCSALPMGGPVNVADRSYFQRALQTGDFAAGDYQIGRITRRPGINFGFPVFDEAGQVQAVVFAALDLSWLNRLAAEASLPPEAMFTVIDRHGTILADSREPQRRVGQSLAEAPILKAILSQDGDGTAEVPDLEGIPRLFAYTLLPGAPGSGVYVVVGIPKAVAFADANWLLVRNLAGLALVALLGLAAAWVGSDIFILRRVNALVRATKRLAAGDLSARTGERYGVSELSQLARAFDEMAAALEKRETERERAEEQARREAANAAALVRVAARLNAQLEPDAALQAVCEETARALDAGAASVWLYDPKREVLSLAASFGLPPEYRERAQPLPRTLDDEYAQKMGALFVVPDARRAPDLPGSTLLTHQGIRTIVTANLLRGNQLVGTLNIYSFGEPRIFSDDELTLLQGLAGQAAQAITNARLFTKAGQRLQQLHALRTIDSAITASLDLRVTLSVFLDQVIAQLGVDAAAVLLLNPHAQRLEYAAGRGFRTATLQHTRLRVGEGHAGRAALERRLVSIPNLLEGAGDFTRAQLLSGENFVTYFGAPLIAKGQVKGVLEIFHRAPLDPDPEWLDFLEALGAQAAIAIDSAELFDDLQRSNADLAAAYDATIEGWSRALDLRDEGTEGHTRRVTEMTVRLARAMGMSEVELIQVRRGALLHDIGKMGIPDNILLKPGLLTEEEWAIMRQHPVYAYELLSPIAFLHPALEIPYCHHEKWDGTGYPRGLKGKQIPLAARVFAVVDVWDALRSDRPYRPAWPEEKVRAYLQEQAGKHFDPDVVAVFLQILDSADGGSLDDSSVVIHHAIHLDLDQHLRIL